MNRKVVLVVRAVMYKFTDSEMVQKLCIVTSKAYLKTLCHVIYQTFDHLPSKPWQVINPEAFG